MIVLSPSEDPFLNQALESYLLKEGDLPILLLWRNRPSLFIGRFQNPWYECRVFEAQKRGIAIVRRESGGGAVYQDLGNLNYSLMIARESFAERRGASLVTRALERTFGLSLQVTSRQALEVQWRGEYRKVSGSAFRLLAKRALLHGTLLIESDLKELNYLLNPPREDFFKKKGSNSVRSPVINLATLDERISYESCCASLCEGFREELAPSAEANKAPQQLTQEEFPPVFDFLADRKKYYASWTWRFGKTPPFIRKISREGGPPLLISVEKGVVVNVETDCGEPVSFVREEPYESFLRRLPDRS